MHEAADAAASPLEEGHCVAISDLFRGKALNAVDAKGRVSVPAEFRAAIQNRYRRSVLKEGYDPANVETEGKARNGKSVAIVRDPDQPCFIGYDETYAEQYRSDINLRHADKAGAERERAIKRDQSFFGSSEDFAWDVNGRIVLTQRMRAKVGIDGFIYFFARGETFELWDPLAFYRAHQDEDPYAAEECKELCEDKGIAL